MTADRRAASRNMGLIKRLRFWLRSWLWHRSWFMAPVLAWQYRQRFGHWPSPLAPKRFNEKLFVRMAFDRRPLLPQLAGKMEARAFVAERLGRDDQQAALLGVAYAPGDVDAMALPARYIVKASHASGLVRIVTEDNPITPAHLAALVGSWLAQDYGRYTLEWCYRMVRPAVVFEQLLDHDGAPPSDVTLFCFDGRVAYVQIDSARFTGHTQSMFDRQGRWLDIQVKDYARDAVPPELPQLLPEMIAAAERLSAGIDFVRVDLFDLGDHFVVGELTTTPQGGSGNFRPARWDAVFGAHWKMPGWRVLRG